MVTVGTMVAVRYSLNILSICTGPARELYLLTEKVYAGQGWEDKYILKQFLRMELTP